MMSAYGLVPGVPPLTIYVGDLPEFQALGITHVDVILGEEIDDASNAENSLSAGEPEYPERVGR